ncbi:MAG: hypothetical protein IPO27_13950 [Bacteroidetes bacterium]|nr:hypothetical protein [Bacteroidota bacterium]
MGGYSGNFLNDVWKYDITINQWTWISGTSIANNVGNYGTKNIPGTNNILPCNSENSCSWVDSANNVWVFGGMNPSGVLDAMWRYFPSTNMWAWESGTSNYYVPRNSGTKNIPAASNSPGGRFVQGCWNDDAANLYLYGGCSYPSNIFFYDDVWRFNINNKLWTWVGGSTNIDYLGIQNSICDTIFSNMPQYRFEVRSKAKDNCNNFWFLGGSVNYAGYNQWNDLWVYETNTDKWIWVGGSSSQNGSGSYGIKGISSPLNQPPSRGGSYNWFDATGNLFVFGGDGPGFDFYSDVWKFVPDPNCVSYLYNQHRPHRLILLKRHCFMRKKCDRFF